MLVLNIVYISLLAFLWFFVLCDMGLLRALAEKNKERKKRRLLKKYNKTYTGNFYWERISTEEFGEIVNRPTVIIRSNDERTYVPGDRLHLQACHCVKDSEGDFRIKNITPFFCTVQIKRKIALERLCPEIGSYSAYTFDIIDQNF